MENRQYIPGPPSSGMQQPGQPHPMNIPPPPPPRHPVPPPPPMRTPGGAAYGTHTQFQPSWIPPPPPPMTSAHPQNQHMNYGRPSTAPFAIPPPPPPPPPPQTNNANNAQPDNQPLTSATYIPRHDQPLTSATYIPGHDTIGVGIPPLFEARTPYEAYGHQPRLNQAHGISGVDGTYTRDDPTLYGNVHYDKAQPSGASRPPDVGKSPSNRHNGAGDLSPSEAPDHWPLDRVLLWLAVNGFSDDWQETFKALELQGGEFLELGLGSGGRGNLGKMHQVVYPQLAKECARRGSKYEQAHEREEGKRMRKLIRQIHDGSQETSVSTPQRTDPPLFSAEGLPGFYSNAEPRSAGGGNDMYPDPSAALPAPSSAQRTNGQMRSVTGPPASAGHDSSAHDSPSRESATWFRSEASRIALSSLSDHRRQSPSISSDTGPYPAPSSYRQDKDSPKSGSPAMQHMSPSYPGLSSSSATDLTIRHEHSRGNSTESIPGVGQGHLSTGRYYDSRRQGPEGARPSPQDRQCSSEISSSLPREHSKGIFNLFRRKAKPDSSHPSPEDQFLESPTSPEAHPNGPYPPYLKPTLNSSDVSVGERPSSTHTSDPEKVGRTKQTSKGKRWILATMDGWNYRLIDVSEMESVESLRAGICQNLGISDWGNAQIFVTEPGQSEHEEPVNDTNLSLYRRNRCDPHGSLKLFVRGTVTQSAQTTPRFDGLGVSIPEKPAPSPTSLQHQLHRKPLDGDALNRISPHTPGKPLGSPSQATFKTSPTANGSQDQTPDSEKDIRARYEDHLREVERKQKAYRNSRLHPSQAGIRGTKVIDFDKGRVSPYDKDTFSKTDTLKPLRKAPSAPNESNTLTKVNSLSKRPGDRERARPSQPVHTHGLGAMIASMGRIGGAVGTPSSSVPVPPSPSNRDSASSETVTLDSAASASSQTTPSKFRGIYFVVQLTNERLIADSSRPSSKLTSEQEARKSQESFAAPSSTTSSRKPSLQSRKSFGPEFVFEEHEVSFQRPPNPPTTEESDESSDDGLWAMRPTHQTKQAETSLQKQRPTLTVDTENNRDSKVRFKSPIDVARSAQTSGGETSDDKEQKSGTWFDADEPDTPEEEKPPGPVFAREDVWASRPPVEGVIDDLDKFFPNIDLDAPYLDGPPSPNGRGPVEQKQEAPTSAASHSGPSPVDSSYDAESSTVKPNDAGAYARRAVSRSGGGLQRMKSIREVAQGANKANRTQSISGVSGQRGGDMLRRRSTTKMFGAKIMQISPKPGGQLNRLDPIPSSSQAAAATTAAATTAAGNAPPQRQPTFRIIRGKLIGKGTYGRVYLGINADNGEVLAVKQVEINARIAGMDKDRIKEMVAALNQEIDTMQHLEHPNIVQYLGCERGEFSISIYLEYISGGSIGSCLRKHGKFEESVVKSLTRQTLSGLAYLHDKGILHRDLKADNILLDLDGTCKISDFGISKKTDNIYGNDSTNSMQGSVFWMAPEVIQSQGRGYSAKVDIWSLGCVVLEMFAGRRPWSKEEAIGAIFKLGSLSEAPPIPEDVSLNISPAALSFMLDCFTIDTYDRPTAGTLLTRHPFCEADATYDFLNTELYAKIRDVL
ncbi:hypothetical protein N7510_011184 [Penicillium lagena]|uniref:uncharacterized protein n=1 Tax=Penicillium lagena TaxID=94218 RepID=UPI00253FC374|nr:uncharacterized protein N7510_011184 [Penicillium lagena]KAJ5601650.1 hypothetical protein N7510_011184 [Penicillium lagena]